MLLHCGKAGDIADDSAGTKLGVRGTRLNTCTRCPLRTSSILLSICRAKIESFRVGVVVLGTLPDRACERRIEWRQR